VEQTTKVSGMLRAVALRIVSLKSSSANVERLFSVLQNAQGLRRTKLAIEKLEKPVQIRQFSLAKSPPQGQRPSSQRLMGTHMQNLSGSMSTLSAPENEADQVEIETIERSSQTPSILDAAVDLGHVPVNTHAGNSLSQNPFRHLDAMEGGFHTYMNARMTVTRHSVDLCDEQSTTLEAERDNVMHQLDQELLSEYQW